MTKPKPKTVGGGGGSGLFDGDDEDDLFSGTSTKSSTAPVAQGMSTWKVSIGLLTFPFTSRFKIVEDLCCLQCVGN